MTVKQWKTLKRDDMQPIHSSIVLYINVIHTKYCTSNSWVIVCNLLFIIILIVLYFCCCSIVLITLLFSNIRISYKICHMLWDFFVIHANIYDYWVWHETHFCILNQCFLEIWFYTKLNTIGHTTIFVSHA